MLIEENQTTPETESNNAPIQPSETSDTSWPLFSAKEHDEKFIPIDYLKDFYETAKEDGAMQMVLFFLPGILYRLPQEFENVLDLGAGPTVYTAIAMRNRVKNFYTSDYSLANRNVLTGWIKNEASFDWKNVCEWISGIEASYESAEKMQASARTKMRAVLDVNVHKMPVIQSVHYKIREDIEIPSQFDALITVFCLEYASESSQEYTQAVKNASSLIKTGGYLIQGGVLEAKEYSFGQKRFKCHYLTKDELLDTLKEAGFSTNQEAKEFHLILQDDIFLLISKKLSF